MTALAGVAVTCFAVFGQLPGNTQLPGEAQWSETPVSGVTTTNYSPGPGFFFRVYSPVDAWVAIGQNPDATTGTRVFLPAESERDYMAAGGARLQWIADA